MLVDEEGDGLRVGDGAAGRGDGVVEGSRWGAVGVVGGLGAAASTAASRRDADGEQESEEASQTDGGFAEATHACGEEHKESGEGEG